jgi:hypothetical protein
MIEPGLTIATDQDVRSDDDIDVEIHGGGAFPYVLDLQADIEQDTQVEEVSEIDLDADDTNDNLELDAKVDQDAYLQQQGSVDVDIEENDGNVNVGLQVDISHKTEIEDEIEIEAEDNGDSGANEVGVKVGQDATTIQKFDVDVDVEEAVLAQVNVDADQLAALLQDVDALLDLSSPAPHVDVDTDQDADLETNVAVSFDIQGLKSPALP